MVYDVKLYFNTGFDAGNIPSSPSILSLAKSKTYPSVWKKQDRGLTEVRIKAEYDDIKEADYAKIGDSYYIITNIGQMNGVTQLSLALDPLSSVGGIDSFTILDGWITRASHKTNELFDNSLPVSYEPSKPLKIDTPIYVAREDGFSGTCYVGCVIKLEDMSEKTARTYVDAATNAKVAVPATPALDHTTTLNIQNPNWKNPKFSQNLPNTCVYGFYNYIFKEGKEEPEIVYNEKIKEAITALQELALAGTLSFAYIIPAIYTRDDPSTIPETPSNYYGLLFSKAKEVYGGELTYGTYTPKNKRVYSTANTITVRNIASGDERTYRAQELYNGDSTAVFEIYADLSPEGKPYLQPKYYDGQKTEIFQEAVAGAQWLTAPIVFGDRNAAINAASLAQSYNDITRRENRTVEDAAIKGLDYAMQTAGNVGKLLTGNPKSAIEGAISELTGVNQERISIERQLQDMTIERQRTNFRLRTATQLVEPDIHFPREPSIQGYVGNSFIIYHTHLSDEDMERLDNEFTLYGEPDSRRLDHSDLDNHIHFNFVQAENVAIQGNFSMQLRNAISNIFTNGIRLWHELPNYDATVDNPLKEG